MRLLEAYDGPDGLLDFRLTRDYDPGSVPLYAILSHTWGPDSEEVSLQDLRDGVGKVKAGYDKIRFCGRQARSDGLTFFWIDTCCIDKSNSAELAEALNSMFRWYRNASLCYVFLSDVTSPTDTAWTSAFRASRWFTRGWTLQELIAPTTVQFFAKDGSLLGDKHSLLSLIVEITGISEEAITGRRPLGDFSLQERFSWADKRQTKREEDWAYSLLGIFGVFIPPIYGEGRESAEHRLRNAIRDAVRTGKQVETKEAHFIMPYLSNPEFVKRPELFEELKARFDYGSNHTDGTSQSRVSLFGLGGVGKTQIAIAFVYWLRQVHKDVSVFWVHASTTERFQQAYASFAQQLGILDDNKDPGRDESATLHGGDPGQDELNLVKLWLERKDVGRWLLVIDNADDAEIFFRPKGTPSDKASSNNKHLASYIPECAHVSILITTRNKQTGLRLSKQRRPIAVGNMGDAESQELLSIKLDNSTSEDRQKLANLLESLPLALAQAAAFMQENTMSISQYIALLDKKPAEVLDAEFEAPDRDQAIPHAVMQTWKISFEEIKRQSPLAGHLLSFMALIDRQAIPLEFLEHYVKSHHPDPQNTRSIRLATALGVLKAYSFVTEDKSSGLDMHRLVHLSTQRWLEEQGELHRFSGQALHTVAEVFPEDPDYEDRATCSVHLPHVRAVLKHQNSGSEIEKLCRASLLDNAAEYLHDLWQYADARALAEESLALRSSILGDEHRSTLTVMRRLVWITVHEAGHEDRTQLEAAENMAQQIYETSSRLFGEEDELTLDAIHTLAAVYYYQDRSDEAEALWVGCLDARRKQNNGRKCRTDMVSLAITYVRQGRWKEAEDLMLEIMGLQKDDGMNEEHPSMLRSVDLLSRIYVGQERYEEVLPLSLKAFDISRRVAGEDDKQTISAMEELSWIYGKLNLGEKSADFALKVFEARTKSLGERHPDTLGSMHELVRIYINLGRYQEALSLVIELVDKRTTVLGEEHLDTLESMYAASFVYHRLGRHEECLDLSLKELSTRRKVQGEDHPKLAWTLQNIIRSEMQLGQYEEAEAHAKRCLALRRKSPGPEDVDTLRTMALLAELYSLKPVGRYKEALALFQETLGIAERLGVLAPDDDLIAFVRSGITRCQEHLEAQDVERARDMNVLEEVNLKATSEDPKNVQGTTPEEIEGHRITQSRDSHDVEERPERPPYPDANLSAGPRSEPDEKETTMPGEEKHQPIPNTEADDPEPTPAVQAVEREQSATTGEKTEGTPANSIQPNIKSGDANAAESSPQPRRRLREAFNVRGWSRKWREK
ncbi:hypothetical protein QBC39DRAFT_136109 [Podospora conica]|nr:hypothetical protein QBC39DRAFT_136109 [Schizothecium conicum]